MYLVKIMSVKLRNCLIMIFVVGWLILFNYESLRQFYLNPLFRKELPKVKLLFPPAGWIMFYQVSPSYGFVEVYATREGLVQQIDPHLILLTRAIGYDNINRNALVAVLEPSIREQFCRFLRRKFPIFDNFSIIYAQYPNLINAPLVKEQRLVYQCQ